SKGPCLALRLPFPQQMDMGSELQVVADRSGEVPTRSWKNISSPPDSQSGEQQTGLTVLVAEDNETSCKIFARQLGLLGHTADLVTNGEDALAHWRAGHYDILLTDVQMPGM